MTEVSESADRPQPRRVAQPETWTLLNEEGRHLLDTQRSAAERIETKAALVVGAALTAAQFVAKEPFSSYWLPAAMTGYLLAILCGLACVLPRTLNNIGLDETVRGVWWFDRGRAAAEIVNNRNVAIKANARRHRRRVLWFWAALTMLAIGAIMSVGHLTLGRRTDDRLNGTCVAGATPGTFTCTAQP